MKTISVRILLQMLSRVLPILEDHGLELLAIENDASNQDSVFVLMTGNDLPTSSTEWPELCEIIISREDYGRQSIERVKEIRPLGLYRPRRFGGT